MVVYRSFDVSQPATVNVVIESAISEFLLRWFYHVVPRVGDCPMS